MRIRILIAAICILTSPAGAEQPGFDPKDIVRQVREGHDWRQAGKPSAASREPSAFDNGEFLVDTSITYVPAPENQRFPAVAFDGRNFLVVWEDWRSRGWDPDIYAARVTRDGVVLDSSGIAVSTEPTHEESPAVVFDGENFFVVWSDARSGPDHIYAARVSPEGRVLDPEGVAVCTVEDGKRSSAVAFDGVNLLVVWQDDRNGPESTDIYGARVTPGGVVLDPVGIAICTAESLQQHPAVAFDGGNFLVVWQDERKGWDSTDIYGARVTPGGVVLDTNGIPVSTAANEQGNPAIAFDGANFLVVWADERSGLPDIYGARVTPAGTVLDPKGIPVSTAPNYQRWSAIAFDGANFLVVWADERSGLPDIYGARVTPQGTVLDPEGIPVSTAAGWQWWTAVAFDGENYLAVWTDWRGGRGTDAYAARVTPQGTVVDPSGIPVSTAVSWQESPAAAFDGANYLVVWHDWRSGTCPDIYATRVTADGRVLDPTGIAVSAAANREVHPAVAFDGANFLVVWQDDRSSPQAWAIYAARVTPGGTVLDPNGIELYTASYNQQFPTIAFDGANYLVVWQDWRGHEYDIYATRVTPGGTVLDPLGIAVSTAANSQWYPAVEFDGVNFLVAWQDGGGGDASAIYGARVTPGGAVLEPQGFCISPSAGDQRFPALAFDGGNYLVAWEDWRGVVNPDIYAARVSRAGTVLDSAGIAVAAGAHWQAFPAVGFDGMDFFVLWTGQPYSTGIHGARVAPSGAVVDSFPVVRQEGTQWYPALARGTGSQMFLVYQGWAGTVGGKTYNTDRIWGKLGPFPGVEETMNDERGLRSLGPTIVRGILFLPVSPFTTRYSLFDHTGRKIVELAPGENDIRHLSPGVYFVQPARPGAGNRSATRKLVVQR